MATARKTPNKFDLGKFEQMVPPIRIRIERKNTKTGQMEPIPLPQDVWSKEDAEKIEQIVLNDIAGGGAYTASMVDSSGNTMEWSFAYPTEYFPALIPPGSAAALGHAPQPSPPPRVAGSPAPQPAYSPMGAFGTPVSPPSPPYMPQYQGAQMHNPWAQGQWPMSGPPSPYSPFGYASPPASPQSSSRSGANAELERLREQLDEQRRQALEERHARERDSQAAQFREQLAQLQTQHAEEMRQIRDMMAQQQQQKRPDDDPTILGLKAQIEEQRRANEEARRANEELQRRQEAAAAEQRHREELKALQAANQKQIDALREAMESNKEDPIMRSLLEIQRQQYEASREAARTQAELARESTRTSAEQPRMIVEMMERLRAASGSEQILSQLNQSYAGLMEQQRGIMEMAMGMGQSPGMALAEGALTSGKELLERYMGAKQAEAQAQSRAAQAQAQAAAQMAAQQRASAGTYTMRGPAPAPPAEPYRNADGAVEAPPPDRQKLGGAPPTEAAPPTGGEAAPTGSDDTTASVEDIRTEVDQNPVAPGSPSEADIFGPIAPQVQELREAVANGQATAEMVATVILQAAHAISEQGIEVPVFSLFAEQRFADLVDILLPGAPSEFIGEVLQALQNLINEHGITLEADDDDDDDDDGS